MKWLRHIKRVISSSSLGLEPSEAITTWSGARFSNIGFEIDVTGPGVGVVSCFPGKRYAVMSGTSMACPAVTGVTAAHLSANPSVLHAKKGADRARKIGELLRKAARDVGLATNLQGLGLPHP